MSLVTPLLSVGSRSSTISVCFTNKASIIVVLPLLFTPYLPDKYSNAVLLEAALVSRVYEKSCIADS